jgi:hypothetical protein
MWFVVYLLAAVVVGWLGRNKEIGPLGFFLVAIFVSPPVGLIILLIAHDRRRQKPS